MAGKKLSARCTDEQYLRIVRDAETVGVSVSEFVVTAALNIGARAEAGAMESAALTTILERLDDLDSRLGVPGQLPSNGTPDGPGLADIGEAMTDLYAGQKRTQSALERTDETLQNLTAAVKKIFDHLDRQATQTAPPTAPRPAPIPAPAVAPKAAELAPERSFREAEFGLFHQEYIASQSGESRSAWYASNLVRLVSKFGFDLKVSASEYAAAGVTVPPDFPR